MQKEGGDFILKVFDTFLKSTIDIIYVLSTFYEKVYITKPNTSRTANSEKYIVCKNFRLQDSDYLCEKFFKILVILNNSNINDLTIAFNY